MSNSNNESRQKPDSDLEESAELAQLLGNDPAATLRELLPDTPGAEAAIASYVQRLQDDTEEIDRRTQQS
jgi:hypothetical protein